MYLSRKYQVGGIAYTPYLATQPGSAQETTTTSSGTSGSSDKDKADKVIKKEIVNLLKENGIPSDVNTLLIKANEFLQKSSALSGFSLFGGNNDDYDLTDLIKVQQMVNDVKYNNELKKLADAQIKAEGAGSEIAIDDTGKIYAQTEDGNIKRITPGELSKNRDKYNPLTNNQLLYLREHDSGLAFETSILNDLKDTVGMQSISKYLKDIINAFGEKSQTGYTTKEKPIAEGLQALMANGPDGYYKATNSSTVPKSQYIAALDYLYNTLNPNAKNLLKAKAAADGGDPNKTSDVYRVIIEALDLFPEQKVSVDFDESATKYDPNQSGKKGGSGKDQLTHDTYPEALVSGSGLNPAKIVNIMPQNTGVTLHAYAQDAGPILKNEKDRMNTTNLQVVLTDGYGISGVTNAQSITFGDQLIDPSEYKKMMVDGYTNMKRVYLPVKYAPDGRITPNFEAQQKLEQVQQYITSQNGAVSDAWIKSWLEENIPDAIWNPETKQVEFTNTMPFLVLHGVAAKNRVNFDTDSPYLEHLSNQEGKRLIEDYDRIVTEESVLGKLEHNKAKGAARWKYYSGNIYIPISGPTTGSLIYNHQFFTKDTYTDITQKATANQMRQQIKTNF